MWVTRLDRTRDFVNDAYVELLGVSREEARRIDWSKRIHPDDRHRMIEETLAGRGERRQFTLEARFETGRGDYRWMRAVSQPRRDADGRLVGYIGVATDITIAKQAELELRRLVEERTAELSASESRFRAIFDAVLEMIVLLKPDGTVVEVNRTEASWRHPAPRLSIGKPLWEAPTLAPYPQHVDRAAQCGGEGCGGRDFTPTKSRWSSRARRPPTSTCRSSRCAMPTGEITYLLFEARDITELKAAQEQLRQSQKMEALGQLTGGIAHDFNNLLTVVVGGLDLIAKQVEDEKLKRYADNALAAAERGARLTAQLLAFSRVQRLEVSPTHVAPLIENMRPLLRNVLGPGIAKSFDLDQELMPVMADPTQLELAVLNLAINARDAMAGGGTLYFETRKVRVADDAEMEDGDYIELVDSRHRHRHAARGRGARVRAFLHHQGSRQGHRARPVDGLWRRAPVGRDRADRKRPGRGDHGQALLPPRRAPRRRCRRRQGARPKPRTGTRATSSVLVIDDDGDVRAFIAASLAEFGYDVREAADGESGLELFRAEPPRPCRARFRHARHVGRRGRATNPRRSSRPADPVRVGL